MKILTQNGHYIINTDKFHIISVNDTAISIRDLIGKPNGGFILGDYKNKERAKLVTKEIFVAELQSKPCYEMPLE